MKQMFFFIISRSILLGKKNVLDKVAEKINIYIYIYIMFTNFFRKSYRLLKMWKSAVKPDRLQIKNKVWLMRIACWIPKATNTHLECVILLAFQ
jgi:hypothetical protein